MFLKICLFILKYKTRKAIKRIKRKGEKMKFYWIS